MRSPVLGTAAAVAAAAVPVWAGRHLTSPAARGWHPGAGEQRQLGPLQARVLGDGETVVLLLHGMLGAGSYFGAAYDGLAADATLIVPDLLGFGGSMDAAGPYGTAGHVDALDDLLDAAGVAGRPVTVAGHSMGGSLAIRWAARTEHQVRQVVAMAAPLYRDEQEADRHIRAMGMFERLLSGDTSTSRRVCDTMCRYRQAAQWVAVASRPDVPVPIARAAVRHTWDSYNGAMHALVRDTGWPAALAGLASAGVPVRFLAGRRDPVPSPEQLAEAEADRSGSTDVRWHPTARHDLPLTDPTWCVAQLRA